jgi:hypothetical protein
VDAVFAAQNGQGAAVFVVGMRCDTHHSPGAVEIQQRLVQRRFVLRRRDRFARLRLRARLLIGENQTEQEGEVNS